MSGIDNIKKVMGWLNPNARAACGNCHTGKEVATDLGRSSPTWRCSRGGFQTSRYSICDQYSPKILTGGTPT